MATPEVRQSAIAHLRSRFGHIWDDVCDFIIRPDRACYSVAELGPSVFRISDSDETLYQRVDMDLENMRGMKIKCSWFKPLKADGAGPQPCLIYLHGNCGSRYDGLECLHVLRHRMTLFVYDACGSGLSDGEHVTLGHFERQDLAAVVEFLQSSAEVSALGLWGRSMGGVTALMYAARDPAIKCLIADSPFSTLRRLAEDLVQQHGSWVPKLVVSAAVDKVRKSIARKAHFDINDLDSLKYAAQCHCPAFIFHGCDDDFVQPFHSVEVSEAYGGSCLHRLVQGGHNDTRGADVQSVAVPFLKLYLIDKIAAAAAAAAASAAPPSGTSSSNGAGSEGARNGVDEAARASKASLQCAPSPSAAVFAAMTPPPEPDALERMMFSSDSDLDEARSDGGSENRSTSSAASSQATDIAIEEGDENDKATANVASATDPLTSSLTQGGS